MRKGHVQKKDEQRRTDTTLALARALTYTYQELALWGVSSLVLMVLGAIGMRADE